MPRYTAPLVQNTVSTAFKTIGALWAQSGTQLRRCSVYEIVVGLSGALNTSNDTQVLFDVSRFITTSTLAATAVTPSPLDAADSVTDAFFSNNATAEFASVQVAGSGLSMLSIPVNQRGTFRWRALDDGDNIIIPATALSGLAVRVLSLSYTGSAQGSIMYQE